MITMPSALPRISAVVERPIYEAIELLAKKDGVSLSQKTRDLLLEALELIEDAGLEAIVERRRKNRAPAMSHAELRRRLKIK
jgi:hypothetical protein